MESYLRDGFLLVSGVIPMEVLGPAVDAVWDQMDHEHRGSVWGPPLGLRARPLDRHDPSTWTGDWAGVLTRPEVLATFTPALLRAARRLAAARADSFRDTEGATRFAKLFKALLSAPGAAPAFAAVCAALTAFSLASTGGVEGASRFDLADLGTGLACGVPLAATRLAAHRLARGAEPPGAGASCTARPPGASRARRRRPCARSSRRARSRGGSSTTWSPSRARSRTRRRPTTAA